MSKAAVFESRLSKLERGERRLLRLTGGALLLVLAVLPMIGATMFEKLPQVITAQKFPVIDDSGNGSVAWVTGQVTAEEEAVLAVVQKFFDTMTARDVVGARETLIIEGQIASFREGPDRATVRTTPLKTYLEGLGSGTRLLEERMWDPTVIIHGRIAVVWTPYDFYNDGELSHCGIDIFSLLMTDEEWKIAGLTYTFEPMGCEKLGQPARRTVR